MSDGTLIQTRSLRLERASTELATCGHSVLIKVSRVSNLQSQCVD